MNLLLVNVPKLRFSSAHPSLLKKFTEQMEFGLTLKACDGHTTRHSEVSKDAIRKQHSDGHLIDYDHLINK